MKDAEKTVGAVAVIDALGFKGIWRRHSAQEILGKISDLKAYLEDTFNSEGLAPDEDTPPLSADMRVAFFSDTIILSAGTRPESADALGPDLPARLITLAADHVGGIVYRAATARPPLFYRGCISYGEYVAGDNVVVGPAIDDAAENMDEAQGAFVWLTPKALTAYETHASGWPLIQYPVPLHVGHSFPTFAVAPFERGRTHQEIEVLKAAVKREMRSNALDVSIKAHLTVKFLDEAADARMRLGTRGVL
jgi:hypothetical protein